MPAGIAQPVIADDTAPHLAMFGSRGRAKRLFDRSWFRQASRRLAGNIAIPI